MKETGAKKAAGIFLKKGDVSSLPGQIIGHLADNMIACGLGISCVYWLTLMGKDHYLLKGAGLGVAEWTALYGVASRIGATSIFPTKPKDALAAFSTHLVFGATKMIIAINLGDERLFSPGNFTQEIKKPQGISFHLNDDSSMPYNNSL